MAEQHRPALGALVLAGTRETAARPASRAACQGKRQHASRGTAILGATRGAAAPQREARPTPTTGAPILHSPVARRSSSGSAGARCNGCMAAAAALPRRFFTGSGAAPQPAGLCPSPPPRPPAARPRAASRRPAPPPPAAPRAGEGSEAAAEAARSRCSAPRFAPADPPPPPAAERGPTRLTTQRAPAARLRARAEVTGPPAARAGALPPQESRATKTWS